MKKNTRFGIVMLLAFSLALPIYSMADMTLTLRTEDGFSVTTNTPTIKSFAVDNDKNLIVILKDPPILDFGNPYPRIIIDTPSACTILDYANVRATPRTTFSFTVRTTTPGATLSADTLHQGTSIVPDYYGATFVASGDTGIFSWNTAGTTAGIASIASAPSGRYLAVFTATQSTFTSQLVVMINISQQYKLTLTAGTGGVVSPAGETSYDPGTQVQISATASSGYYFSGWSDGGTDNPRTVTMNQDKTISAAFTQTPPTHTINAQVVNSAGGSVSPASRAGISYGSTTTFTVTTNAGYTASVSEGSLNGTTWTTAAVTSSHTVTVTFTINTYTVNASVVNSAGGSVSPTSRTGVSYGSTTTFTVTTNAGYTASVSEGSLNGTTWTTAPVTSDHTATVSFTSSTPTGTPLPWNTRTNLNLSAGSEQVYIGNVPTSDKIYLSVSIIGITNETDATYTWTFPDGTVFNGAVMNTSVNGILLLRTRTYGYANIPYDYIPAGDHVLRIKANKNSSFVLRTALY